MEIKLTDKDKKLVNHSDDVYDIMQRILLRENKIDREKEHFWIIGMNTAGYILYIELVSLGSVRSTVAEPMNVYRIAVMKNATRVIAIHNHPSGNVNPSDDDKEITDRLIQVGRILDIKLEDHLVISTTTYLSFKAIGLMEILGASLKYVPTYQIEERIRHLVEEKATAEKQRDAVVKFLLAKQITTEEIAQILGITSEEVDKALQN